MAGTRATTWLILRICVRRSNGTRLTSLGPRSVTVEASQSGEQIAGAIEAFLAEYPRAVILEDGRVAFAMHESKYRLSAEHGRCTLHLWSEERNLVRRVSAAGGRKGFWR